MSQYGDILLLLENIGREIGTPYHTVQTHDEFVAAVRALRQERDDWRALAEISPTKKEPVVAGLKDLPNVSKPLRSGQSWDDAAYDDLAELAQRFLLAAEQTAWERNHVDPDYVPAADLARALRLRAEDRDRLSTSVRTALKNLEAEKP